MAKRSKPKRASKQKPARATPNEPQHYEAEVLEGLTPFAVRELKEVSSVQILSSDKASVQFHFSGEIKQLQNLRTVVAVYRLESFNVPRPKALLGHEHLMRLLQIIEEVRKDAPFTSFRFSAAGRDSAVFARLTEEIQEKTDLIHDSEEGDLLLRIRKSKEGWDVLFRTTPRPLSSRPWRICNLSGGLNATLAAAMVALIGVDSKDRFFNPMCGSGTLLIERRSRGQAAQLVGCDISGEALACSEENIGSSKRSGIELLRADATHLPFDNASFDVIVADVPWGDAVGSHKDNAALYPAFLTEMARVAAPGARLAVLTHEIRLFEKVLSDSKGMWQLRDTVRVFHGGHYPRVYLLARA